MSTKALERHLIPILPFLQQEKVTEICINQPYECWVEQCSSFHHHTVEELSYTFLESLAGLIAEYNHKDFPSPLLSGSLPTGERIQFVMNPACEAKKLVCSIRRQQMHDMTLEQYEEQGSFIAMTNNQAGVENANQILQALYDKNHILQFVKFAIKHRKNILISGGTGTGKTTFLNACLKCIPNTERIITVEDTREVIASQPNAAHLLFNESDERITALNIFKACLRLRPDRILLSELRGAEVWPYLRAANSGHPGSLSTIHADNPHGAFQQLVFMMQQAGSTSNETQIRNYIQSIIHVVIQLKRDHDPGRFMNVSEVWFQENHQ